MTLPTQDARRAASSIFWIFSRSTGRKGRKKRMVRRRPIVCFTSMVLVLSGRSTDAGSREGRELGLGDDVAVGADGPGGIGGLGRCGGGASGGGCDGLLPGGPGLCCGRLRGGSSRGFRGGAALRGGPTRRGRGSELRRSPGSGLRRSRTRGGGGPRGCLLARRWASTGSGRGGLALRGSDETVRRGWVAP